MYGSVSCAQHQRIDGEKNCFTQNDLFMPYGLYDEVLLSLLRKRETNVKKLS